MKRISQNDIQRALDEQTEQLKPTNNMAHLANDYTKSPTLWNAPQLNINKARAWRHAEIAKGNAAKQD